MNRITFKPSLLIKMSGIAFIAAIPLSTVIVYLLLSSDSSTIRAFNYYSSWALAILLPLGNFYVYLKCNWEVVLDENIIKMSNNLILKTLEKAIPYTSIKTIQMKGMLSKSIQLKYNGSIISIPQTSLHVNGKLPDLVFHEGALHGPIRDLYKLKFEIEKRSGVKDCDPFPPYKTDNSKNSLRYKK